MDTEATEFLPLDDENATIKIKTTYLHEILNVNAFYIADRTHLKQTLVKMEKEKFKAEKNFVAVEKDCRTLAAAIHECGDIIKSLESENTRLKKLVADKGMQLPNWDAYEDPRELYDQETKAFVEPKFIRLDNPEEHLRPQEHGEVCPDIGEGYEESSDFSETDERDLEDEKDGKIGVKFKKAVLEHAESLILADRESISLAQAGKQSVVTTTLQRSGRSIHPTTCLCEFPPIPLSEERGISDTGSLLRRSKFELPPTPISMDSRFNAKKTTHFETGIPIPFQISRLTGTGSHDDRGEYETGNSPGTGGIDGDSE